jgi:hypothetical protein
VVIRLYLQVTGADAKSWIYRYQHDGKQSQMGLGSLLMALAHTISNKAEAACRRGDLFEKRRKLMEVWAGYCATPKAEKMVLLRKQALS